MMCEEEVIGWGSSQSPGRTPVWENNRVPESGLETENVSQDQSRGGHPSPGPRLALSQVCWKRCCWVCSPGFGVWPGGGEEPLAKGSRGVWLTAPASPPSPPEQALDQGPEAAGAPRVTKGSGGPS